MGGIRHFPVNLPRGTSRRSIDSERERNPAGSVRGASLYSGDGIGPQGKLEDGRSVDFRWIGRKVGVQRFQEHLRGCAEEIIQ